MSAPTEEGEYEYQRLLFWVDRGFRYNPTTKCNERLTIEQACIEATNHQQFLNKTTTKT